MDNEVIFFGWNRSVPGREKIGLEHFQEILQYLGGLQQSGAIQSFEPVLLANHGGDLNGFLLIRGNSEQLNALAGSKDWMTHTSRGGYHLEGSGAIRGVSGDGVMEWMNLYGSILDKYG